ncbi:hypothetical protein [Mycobacterium leprae]|uniref:hypothetical protein n=1 Tax=Mycobacterium leprae TaxID=1769 RepID=UPI000ACEE211
MNDKLAAAALVGNEHAWEHHIRRGKLLPCERVHWLLDMGSPLLELASLATGGM